MVPRGDRERKKRGLLCKGLTFLMEGVQRLMKEESWRRCRAGPECTDGMLSASAQRRAQGGSGVHEGALSTTSGI